MSARIQTYNDDGSKGESVFCPGDTWQKYSERYEAWCVCWTVTIDPPFWPSLESAEIAAGLVR